MFFHFINIGDSDLHEIYYNVSHILMTFRELFRSTCCLFGVFLVRRGVFGKQSDQMIASEQSKAERMAICIEMGIWESRSCSNFPSCVWRSLKFVYDFVKCNAKRPTTVYQLSQLRGFFRRSIDPFSPGLTRGTSDKERQPDKNRHTCWICSRHLSERHIYENEWASRY